jgi:hypothetical protein
MQILTVRKVICNVVYYVTHCGVFWKGKVRELIPILRQLQLNYDTVEEIILKNHTLQQSLPQRYLRH